MAGGGGVKPLRQQRSASKSGRAPSPLNGGADEAEDCDGEIALRHPWVDAERKRRLHESVQRLVAFLRDRRAFGNLTPNSASRGSGTPANRDSMGSGSFDAAAVNAALRSPSASSGGQAPMDWADALADPLDLAAYEFLMSNCEALFVSDLFRASLVRQPLFCLALARDLD